MSVLVYHAALETLVWKGQLDPLGVDAEGAPDQFNALSSTFAPELAAMRTGIFVFFVLSGYLLTRTFIASFTLDTPRPSIPRYFRNRALRIIPAFWVVTTVYVIWNHAGGAGGLAAVYAFAQNYHWTQAAEVMPQAWTLDIEMAFYILIPIAALAFLAARPRLSVTATRRLAIVLVALLAGYILSLASKHHVGVNPHNAYNLANYLFAFIPGVALAAVEPFAAPRLRNSRSGAMWAWGSLALCVLALGAFLSIDSTRVGLRLVLITLGCGALVAAPLMLQWSTGDCWRILDNRPMHWLGERSYGIYLIHLGLMVHVLSHIGGARSVRETFVLLVIVATALTLLGADLLWRIVERPALQRRLPWRQAEFARTTAPGGAEA